MLDPFGGAGSTLIACAKTGRRARLIELDPTYVDTIVQRWQGFTGGTAILDGDGRSFDVIAAGRAAAALSALAPDAPAAHATAGGMVNPGGLGRSPARSRSEGPRRAADAPPAEEGPR